jgi:hypothetical protein
MKKFIVLLVSVFAMSSFNAFATNNETKTSTQSDSNWYTCQFSLDHYTGTTFGRPPRTNEVRVLLNCPQQNDVTATVFVYIDGKRVASKLFTISAGNKESGSSVIILSSAYSDVEYTLDVK